VTGGPLSRIEAICLGALQREPSSRAAFLDDACGGDDALRREVESLLAHEQTAERLFGASAVDLMVAPAPPSMRVGERLGPYRIDSPLAAGGMGEVYRARDTVLNRDVAIKALPVLTQSDPERRARFGREARLLAALNHPNIAAIHALEQWSGTPALVLELVEGDTLADRVRRGALPLRDALTLARQMTDALAAAHDKGIIHRDLKPSNISVTPEGIVKLLDFGLAKALADNLDAQPGPGETSLTVTAAPHSVILGTPAYMSPEQAQGGSVDRRTDIWAFGCVLYEMLTGKTAFSGETASDTLASVITREPDWTALPVSTPPAVHRLLRRCLEKDRAHRLADIADARLEIDDALMPSSNTTDSNALPRLLRRRAVWAAGGAAVALSIAGAVSMYSGPPRASLLPVRFAIAGPQRMPVDAPAMALSPDGTRLVFVAAGSTGDDRLWVRRLDQFDATELPGTEDGASPFWAPDSETIAFFARGQLKRISIAGGPPRVVCDVVSPQTGGTAGSWGRSGDIVFAQRFGPLQRVPAQGGEAVPVTAVDPARHEFGHYSPVFLPDGDHFLFEVGASPERGGVRLGSLTSAETRQLTARSVNPIAMTAAGVFVFIEGGGLRAQKLDIDRATLVDDPIALADDVAEASASASGALAYRTFATLVGQLTWFDRAGNRLGLVSRPGRYESPVLSPDGMRVAVARDRDVWVLDLARNNETRLTLDAAGASYPVWSPDGRQVVFTKGGRMLRKAASGTGAEEVIAESAVAPVDWSADGRFITYFAYNPDTQADLYVLPAAGPHTPMLFFKTRFLEAENRLSPDGRWMAYTSDESGRLEVYVQTFPPSAQKILVSTAGGMQPFWGGNRRELFYLALDRMIMSVKLDAGATINPGVPQPLFRIRTRMQSTRNSYVPAGDGQRFLVNEYTDSGASSVSVILNWPALLPN